ncbi:GAF and ANTAR domain-containing protein [Kribbella sp. NPDC026596]|uniref:GAF and ANTAR domain-containing protein n=1 Tax=Kribbella sp. NPDC026596 TaxID=3155122 RepID=UPI0034010379
MPNQPDLSVAAALAQLTVDLHDAGVEQVAAAVVEFAAQTLAWPFASLVLTRRAGRVELAALSDPAIGPLCRGLLTEGSPLLVVARGNDPVVVDYSNDQVQPPVGVAAVAHLPLRVKSSPVGALSLYESDSDRVGNERLTIAALLAQHASAAIAQARHRESILNAVEARKLIGQAVGILMQRFDIGADLAFHVLSRHSQHSNIKLREIAEYVLRHRRLPTPPGSE